MLEKIRVVFTIPELRQKILLTLLLLAIFRIGGLIPLPGIDTAKMNAFFASQGSGTFTQLLDQIATFSASNLQQATIFGMGIMPYISASIIFQLLASVYPPLEKLQKEGETGRKKINEYTRYATIGLCVLQSLMYLAWLGSEELILPQFTSGFEGYLWRLTAVMTMTAGTAFLMWLGEQIDEYGIGNGISLLIMAGILAQLFPAGYTMVEPMIAQGVELAGSGGKIGVDTMIVLAAMFVAVVAGVVFVTQGQRRIPMQSAKHVRGRRVFGGGARTYLPLRVNHSGVMPIVFASSLLIFPSLMFNWLSVYHPAFHEIGNAFHRGDGFIYNVCYIALIYFFCYFWTAISFDPKKVADDLKNHGSFIPGHRPGRQTASYLEKVMVRITYVGAGFLAAVAILPTIVATWMNVDYNIASFYGGTSLLIAVSVTFDLVQKIDSHLVMRNYKGLLE